MRPPCKLDLFKKEPLNIGTLLEIELLTNLSTFHQDFMGEPIYIPRVSSRTFTWGSTQKLFYIAQISLEPI